MPLHGLLFVRLLPGCHRLLLWHQHAVRLVHCLSHTRQAPVGTVLCMTQLTQLTPAHPAHPAHSAHSAHLCLIQEEVIRHARGTVQGHHHCAHADCREQQRAHTAGQRADCQRWRSRGAVLLHACACSSMIWGQGIWKDSGQPAPN